MVNIFSSFFLAPVIILEQTLCATSKGSSMWIKQHGHGGVDYFGITAGRKKSRIILRGGQRVQVTEE